MKRKIEKMSGSSHVKLYKKGNHWVSSLILTVGISALSLSSGSLIASADSVVTNSSSNSTIAASVPSSSAKADTSKMQTNSVASTTKASSQESAKQVSSSSTVSVQVANSQGNSAQNKKTQVTSANTPNQKSALPKKSQTNKTAISLKLKNSKSQSLNNAPISDKLPAATDNYHMPDYHIHNVQGWSNDVQTITQNPDGSYNVYFLHSVDGATNPFGPDGQDWEHVTTKDWVHFTDNGIAINSHGTDNPDSWKSAWTGSIIQNNGDILGVPKGAEVAYFSGLSKKDGSQNIWAAWSDNGGKTFVNALNDGAPVLAWNSVGASQQPDQERDADVIYWNGKLLMYTAEGKQLGVYQSQDGVHWTLANPNGISKILPATFFHGLNWKADNVPVECPQIRLMKGSDGQAKAVLFYGGKDPNGNPAQTTGTYYVVGHLDKNGLFVADQNAARLDLGSDYYGSNISGNDNLNTPKNSLIGLGWVGNWSYTSSGVYNNQNDHQYPADRFQLENHLGAYTAPRVLTLQKVGSQYQIVSKIDLPVKTDSTSTTNVKDNAVVGNDSPYGSVYKVDDLKTPANQIFTIHVGTTDKKAFGGRIYVRIGQGKDAILFNYDTGNGMMAVNQNAVELENDMNGSAANNYQQGATGGGYVVNTGYKASDGTPFDLKFFCDKTSVEVQFPNGQIYTVARYSVNNNQDITIYAQDPNGDNLISFGKQSLRLANNKPNRVKEHRHNKHISSGKTIGNSHSTLTSNDTRNSASSKTSVSPSNSNSLNNGSLIPDVITINVGHQDDSVSAKVTKTQITTKPGKKVTVNEEMLDNKVAVSSIKGKSLLIPTSTHAKFEKKIATKEKSPVNRVVTSKDSVQIPTSSKTVKPVQSVVAEEKGPNNVTINSVTTNVRSKATSSAQFKSQSSKNTLPQTGETSNKGTIIAGIMTVLSALGLVKPRRRN